MKTVMNTILTHISSEYSVSDKQITLFETINSGLETIANSFASKSGQTVIAGPTDREISRIALKVSGSISMHLPATPFVSDSRGLLDLINEKTDLVYLASPGAPSGVIYSEKDIRRALEASAAAVVIVDETESLIDDAGCAGLLGRYSNLIVLRSIVDLSEAQSRICVFALGAESVVERLSLDDSISQNSDMLERILASLLNSEETMRKKQVIRENKALLNIKLRKFGIEIHDTNSDSVLIRTESPLELQLALEENGVPSRNCVGLPQLGEFIRISLSDDQSARSLIDAVERLPRKLFEDTRSQERAFNSTITVNGSSEK